MVVCFSLAPFSCPDTKVGSCASLPLGFSQASLKEGEQSSKLGVTWKGMVIIMNYVI